SSAVYPKIAAAPSLKVSMRPSMSQGMTDTGALGAAVGGVRAAMVWLEGAPGISASDGNNFQQVARTPPGSRHPVAWAGAAVVLGAALDARPAVPAFRRRDVAP